MPGPGDKVTLNDIDVTFIGIETVANSSISPAEGKIYVLCGIVFLSVTIGTLDTDRSIDYGNAFGHAEKCYDLCPFGSARLLTGKGQAGHR